MKHKEIQRIVRGLEGLGYQVKRTGKGHFMVSISGCSLTTLPSSPSDHRSMQNCRSDIRRITGFDIFTLL